ncbi:Crp/Fnr family transcriptional regulator [Undibacterium jejuense]|uniref:Crp/Fnr family transcriptional regulator n=1 Tax=Undibacterium jejuense TaxID=1344949 RepID=A0A923KIW0_9BURK|nr:Crp/Fnr family transcriptional regulator [Undibacterium jejuense]MBC3863352.1 Crp/Fnr family transcriptional regulator [Undibacterium jejuense]
MSTPISPMQNRLLASLVLVEFERLKPNLEVVNLAVGDIIYESGARQEFVYFPTTAVISLLYMMEDGELAEIASIGSEGIVGISWFLGGHSAINSATVQRAGDAYRLRGRYLKEEFDRAGSFLRLLLRYTQALITQMTQIALCHRYHNVEQQLCRWLLQNMDRSSSNSMKMTQQLIANSLGFRRERITEVASKLQDQHIIRYSRGSIVILDRAGLEKKVCECYWVIRQEFDHMLHQPQEHQNA